MKYFFIFLSLGLLNFSCADGLKEAAKSPNTFSARIDSLHWTSSSAYTHRSLNEGGPLTILGTGDGYTIEIVLGGITETGEYEMGTSRIGKIKYGNYTYSTLDVPNAGNITISSFSENRIIGEFYFDAQWLNANNKLKLTDGKFDVSYY